MSLSAALLSLFNTSCATSALARIRFVSHTVSGAGWVLGPLLVFKATNDLKMAALFLIIEWITRAALSLGIGPWLRGFAPSRAFYVLENVRAGLFVLSATLLLLQPWLNLGMGFAWLIFTAHLFNQVAYTCLQGLTEMGIHRASQIDKASLYLTQSRVRTHEIYAACFGALLLSVLSHFEVPIWLSCLFFAILCVVCAHRCQLDLIAFDQVGGESMPLEKKAFFSMPRVPENFRFLSALVLCSVAINIPLSLYASLLPFWFSSPEKSLVAVAALVSTYKLCENFFAASALQVLVKTVSRQSVLYLGALLWFTAAVMGLYAHWSGLAQLSLTFKVVHLFVLAQGSFFLVVTIRYLRQKWLSDSNRLQGTQWLIATEMMTYPLAGLVAYVWGYENGWIYPLGLLGVVGLLRSATLSGYFELSPKLSRVISFLMPQKY